MFFEFEEKLPTWSTFHLKIFVCDRKLLRFNFKIVDFFWITKEVYRIELDVFPYDLIKLCKSFLSQICINGLPYEMNEDFLIPLFESVGVVVQFRLLMKYPGLSCGTGFVIYSDPLDARRAIAKFNNYVISPSRQLQLFVSKNMRRLWLGYVDHELDVDSAMDLIQEKVDPEEVRHQFIFSVVMKGLVVEPLSLLKLYKILLCSMNANFLMVI